MTPTDCARCSLPLFAPVQSGLCPPCLAELSVVEVPTLDLATCTRCTKPVPHDAPLGLCPRCLLAGASPEPLPTEIGDYAIRRELGSGSTGVVYLAEQLCTPPIKVALKVLRARDFADEEDLERFRSEATIQSQLQHPNIVQIFDARGLSQAEPYFAMQYIEGASLADPAMQEHFSEPERAARLIETVARAVHCAHKERLVHFDLKPSNMLLDRELRVYVSDFSLARRLRSTDDVELDYTAPEQVRRHAQGLQVPGPGEGCVGGTAGYMAPEQLPSAVHPLSLACDVYGLGATLYELLTGRLPREVDDSLLARPRARFDVADLAESLSKTAVIPPRQLAPHISRELELVCLGALELDPNKRYQSAEAFADDLERARQSRPVAPPNVSAPSAVRRTQLWMRRHPVLAMSALLGALLFTLGDLLVIRELERHKREVINVWLASGTRWARVQADAVLRQFQADKERLLKAATDGAVLALLTEEGSCRKEPAALRDHGDQFKSVFLVKADGTALARYPLPSCKYFEKRDEREPERDYFHGARDLEPGQVYVSKAFRSRESADGVFKFAYATPLFQDGTLAGVLVATRDSSESLGDVRIEDDVGGTQLTTLVGPRDPSDGPVDSPFSVIVHARLPQKREHPLETKLAERLDAAFRTTSDRAKGDPVRTFQDSNFRDPVFPGQHHVAAFVPVGSTGYAVAVHADVAKVLGPAHRLSGYLAYLATGLHLSLLLAVVWNVAGTIPPRRQHG